MDNRIISRIWRFVRIPLAVIFVLYVALVIYRIPAAQERIKTQEVVDKIKSQKLTLADVMGERLPSAPDPSFKDATVAGIDLNANGIRDDVELAIFKLYPDSARIRAAELQFAMALQFGLGQVFNTGTAVAMAQKRDRGFGCIGSAAPKVNLSDSPEMINKSFAVSDARIKEVEGLVFNTPERKAEFGNVYEKYIVTYSEIPGPECDINLSLIPN